MTGARTEKTKPRDLFILQEGLGDAVAFSALCEPYFRRFGEKILVAHKCPEIFAGNPFCEVLHGIHQDSIDPGKLELLRANGFNPIFLTYCDYPFNPALSCTEIVYRRRHMIETMGARLGLSGKIASSPRIFLTPEEAEAGRRSEKPQIVLLAQGKNEHKTVPTAVLRQVCERLLEDGRFEAIQIGLAGDELVSERVMDLRGKTTVREAAAILANSALFVGPLGFSCHLAHAMRCRSVVLLPQSEPQELATYQGDEAVFAETQCDLCRKENLMLRGEQCPNGFACIRTISPDRVVDAARRLLDAGPLPAEADVWDFGNGGETVRDMSLYEAMRKTLTPRLELFRAMPDEPFSEKNLISIPIHPREAVCECAFRFRDDGRPRRFRLDFNPEPGQVFLIRELDFLSGGATVLSLKDADSLDFANLGSRTTSDGLLIFPADHDPQIFLKPLLRADSVKIRFDILEPAEASRALIEAFSTLNSIENSTTWKLSAPIRKLLGAGKKVWRAQAEGGASSSPLLRRRLRSCKCVCKETERSRPKCMSRNEKLRRKRSSKTFHRTNESSIEKGMSMSLRTKLCKIAALAKRLSIHNIIRAIYWLFHEDFHSFRDRLNRHALIAHSEQIELELDRVESFDWEACEPLVFPKREHPLVSILVPVYNQIDYTYACLKSVLTRSGDVSYEVILADDASTDETKDIEQKIKNIVVVRNETNLRFLRNCNNAAQRARGKYLLFLNNDTQVQRNWLAPLCDVLDNDPSAGAVGGMLIYPDGRLQEAGGIIWRDASGANYGHGDNPVLSDYNYRKEVDYISGASLMVRKSLWDRLGGFDDRFSPAYYEDTDLCFSIRTLGFKVVYQPLSKVVHFEGVSNGTDLSSGQKRHQVENQVKFREKWKDVLDREHFEPGQDEFLARDRGGGKRRLFVLDHLVPAYDTDAGGRCTWRYLKLFLEKGFRITFLPDNFHDPQPYTREMQQLGINVLYGNRYYQNWKTWLPTVARYFDFAFLQRPHITIRYLDLLKKHSHAKIVYFGHDLHFLRERRQYELEHDNALLKASEESKRIEYEIFSKSDDIFCVGSYERKLISDAFPGKPVHDIPLYFYDAPAEPHPDPENCRDLLFVGGFNHPPNRDCVLWFAKEVFPKIRKELPGVKWRVVGSNPPPQIEALASDDLIISGFVSDEELSRLYATSRIAVVPLRYGAGVKGKVVEALRFGIPLVTTSIGAEGISSDAPLKLADDAESFADAVIQLYRSPELCRELSAKCASFIERNYSAAKAKEILQEVMPDEEDKRDKPTRSAIE